MGYSSEALRLQETGLVRTGERASEKLLVKVFGQSVYERFSHGIPEVYVATLGLINAPILDSGKHGFITSYGCNALKTVSHSKPEQPDSLPGALTIPLQWAQRHWLWPLQEGCVER